jgi:hypothetical protein
MRLNGASRVLVYFRIDCAVSRVGGAEAISRM